MRRIILILLSTSLLTGCSSMLGTLAIAAVAGVVVAQSGILDHVGRVDPPSQTPYVPSAVESANKFAEIDRQVARNVAARTGGYSAERAETTGHGYESSHNTEPMHNRLSLSPTASSQSYTTVATPEPQSPVSTPKADLVCKPGSTWHDVQGIGAPGGTCYKDTQLNVTKLRSDQVESNTNTPERTNNGQSVTDNGQSETTHVAESENRPVKTKWGPIQMEALAICRKSEKSGKWWCDGPGQELILFDNETVQEALNSVGCSSATSSAGGTTKSGKSADVFRCGYGLHSYDRDIKKIHGLVTAQRTYICEEYPGSYCTTIYDGQDKR
ncbi:hypothetical protein [Methylobacter sp.]